MKKLVLLAAWAALFAASVFVACQKDQPAIEPTLSACANPKNPFDFVGARHNEALDILAKHNPQKRRDLAGDFQILSENGFGKADHQLIMADFALMMASKDPFQLISDKLLKEGRIGQDLHAALFGLKKIILENTAPGLLASEIRSFEANISGMGLSENEEKALLMACSVARHSNQYWNSATAKQREQENPADADWINFIDIIGMLDYYMETGDVFGSIMAGGEASFGASINVGGGANDLPAPVQVGWAYGDHPDFPDQPCKADYWDICAIENTASASGAYYMAGSGFAMSADAFVLGMDGSQLAPEFIESLSTGTWDLETDYTVPQEVVNGLLHAGGFPATDLPTVFTAGPKEVVSIDDTTLMITIQVVMNDGAHQTWFIIIKF